MLQKLLDVKSSISNWDAVLFALYYHDVVYNALKSDNEEKSAVLAKTRMTELGVSEKFIGVTDELILATKKHTTSANADINYFTDADLSILGQEWPVYENYFKSVRKEYSIYPDLVYKPGRRKVLQHFLDMEKIFKTNYFHSKLEEQAKQNLQQELNLLK